LNELVGLSTQQVKIPTLAVRVLAADVTRGSSMVRRIVAAIVAVVFGALALWMLIRLLYASTLNALNVVFGVFAFFIATIAILCGWFALRGHLPGSRLHIRLTIYGAFIVGGIAFAAGFAGPLIFQPQSNQGPLLGIFFTGPLGFVLGAAIGWFYGRFRHKVPIESA
jgi:hypothetical protein